MKSAKSKSFKSNFPYLILFLTLIAGFAIGLLVKGTIFDTNSSNLKALRLGGYKFISPLLFCDAGNSEESTDQKLENKIKQLVDKPVMIAYFKLARTDPKILDKKIMVSFEEDTNSVQGIKPKDYAKNGRTYSVQELIEKMIKHSDNNAAYALTYNIDQNLLDQTFKDLKIPYPTSEVADYISASDFSYFFRVLYNATYLKRDLSERALNILSEVDYKEGLVAGVPKDVPVAHKYGLGGNIDRSNSVYNELHDCGIVYHPREPYFLCVMTKSISDTPIIESTIKSISSEVYKEVERAANVSP
ncbi:MAG: Beta-lactamase class A-like protein [candidate division CPR2 bacterium GW2011_GWC1_41_48]|uniref:Beta-lactamase class A-like protein n=1 Tax=candidate division CPR2 bacterium GW2011_GWC1_41_48 TaxID=1618344 RepID=A0A0G0YH55_UNCC2|nr:MAG: Beta-lactamase class A-like protein [candidate division CPR2 bacterium GW2011_GWC1_41_48]